eukprot:1140019-Pelagomonas_calceolata.AAC.3
MHAWPAGWPCWVEDAHLQTRDQCIFSHNTITIVIKSGIWRLGFVMTWAMRPGGQPALTNSTLCGDAGNLATFTNQPCLRWGCWDFGHLHATWPCRVVPL